MVNPFKEVNWNPGPRERRKFALSLIIGFPCIAALLLLAGVLRGKGWNLPLAAIVGGGGLAVGLVLLAVPQIARPILCRLVFCGLLHRPGGGQSGPGHRVLRGAHRARAGHAPAGPEAGEQGFDKRATTYWHDGEQVDDPNRYYRQF